MKDQFPLSLAVVVPFDVLPVKISIVVFASAVPLTVGVLLLVTLSVLELPVSEAEERSGVEGAAGGIPETVMVFPLLSAGDELAPAFQFRAPAMLYALPPPEEVPFLLSSPASCS